MTVDLPYVILCMWFLFEMHYIGCDALGGQEKLCPFSGSVRVSDDTSVVSSRRDRI